MNEDATFLALKGWIPYSARNFKAMIFNKSNSELIFKNWNTLTFEKRTGYTIDDPYFIMIKWEDIPEEYIKEFVRLADK